MPRLRTISKTISKGYRQANTSRWLGWTAILVVVVALAALWKLTPLREYTNDTHLQALSQAYLLNQWWSIFIIIPIYVLASLLMFPNLVLNIAVILSIGGWLGWLYAVCGSLSAATVFFLLGRLLGMKKLDNFKYAGIAKAKLFLRKGGIPAVVAVRVLPSAPYAVVNSVAGTLDISYHDFIMGTFIAHLPGTLSLALLGQQLKTVLSQPSPLNISILISILCGAGLLIWWLHSRVKNNMEDVSSSVTND
jgi:uncharacterized membrane protein YdjX (TVP38/TMEM64 family)